MPQYRADFDLSSTLVLPEGSPPIVITKDKLEIIIKNADLDDQGHIPGLIAQVVSEAPSLDDAQNTFRELLAKQLDILSFVTHSQFKIDQCFRVSEWEPHQKDRQARIMKKFDKHYPPLSTFLPELQETVRLLSSSETEVYVQRALNYFRKGLIADQLEDQFQYFWLAIEVIAEGNKNKTKVPIPCPVCKGALLCRTCDCEPQRTPMARQAIKSILNEINTNGDELYKLLIDVRDGLTHGQTLKSISDKLKLPFANIVNEAGLAAWHVIHHVFNQSHDLTFGHTDGDFAYGVMIVGPNIIYSHDGPDPHPPDDKIPLGDISVKVSF